MVVVLITVVLILAAAGLVYTVVHPGRLDHYPPDTPPDEDAGKHKRPVPHE